MFPYHNNFSGIMNKLNNISITKNFLITIHKHRKFITPLISKIINSSGSKLNKIAITLIILIMMHLQNFILYSISAMTIIIIDRRQSIIKVNFLLKTWGA